MARRISPHPPIGGEVFSTRMRMEGWRQRRLGSNSKNPYREEKEKPT
jgi:hypothetical protein